MADRVRVPYALIILLAFSASGTVTEFVESPMSQNVSAGQRAEFRCRHSTADIIRWRVNGILISRSSPPDGVGLDADGFVDILTITGRLDNNGTVVQCVARFDNGSPEQVSDPVFLTVTDFSVWPLSMNASVGRQTLFHCEHSRAVGISWLINGTTLRNLTGLHSTFRESSSGSVRSLNVTVLSQYNSTMIECVAVFSNGQQRKAIPPALLHVQGPLAAVTSLTNANTTISWEPPFSLDLTEVEPDIVYCVEVYNITCGRSVVISDCAVTDTNYTSLSDGYLYEYIVTPRSNVEGAQNGTASQPLKDILPTFSFSSFELSFVSLGSQTDYQVQLSYTPALPIPSSYTLLLEPLNRSGDPDHVEVTAIEIWPNLLLSAIGRESRRLWNCIILAFGCIERSLLSIQLSTHDFQDISISSPSPGVVRVTGRFVEGSPSTGVLVIISGDSGVTYHLSSRNSSGSHTVTIPGLAGGEYTVSVFVVEENGLPFERAAMVPEHLSIQTNPVDPSPPTIEYSIESNSTGVCVQCNFLTTDASECIAVVHRRHDLMNIESSHKFTRSGDTASGCIEGVNLEDYQVGVVAGRQLKSGPAGASNLTVIFSALIPTVALLAVIVIMLIIIVNMLYHKSLNHSGAGNKEKAQNYYTTYTSSPASPTENPRVPLVTMVPSVQRSVDTYNIIPLDSPSPFSISNDATQASTVSAAVSESSAEDGNNPLYSAVGVNQQPSSSGVAHQTSTSMADSAQQIGISPLYSQVDVKPQSVSVPPVDDEPVVYSEVMKTQGASDQLYAMVNPKSTRESYLDDLTKVVYSEIRPHGVEQPPQSTTPTPTPFTLDNIVTALLPVASKWQAIEEAFPLSQKWLYDTETEDVQCLREVIKAYLLRHDVSHTWDEIVDVLKKIGEDSLAEKIFKVHVAPYVLTLPNQPQLPEGGVYTHGSKSLSRNVSTDDGSLDTSSPVLSGQQTEPVTSVASEGEVKPDNEESLPTPGETVCTPESHGDAVLEMPDSSINGSKVEVTGGAHEVKRDSNQSSKGRVVADGDSDSGVIEGRESSLMLEIEDDMSSHLTVSSIESEAKASGDVEKETHQVIDKSAQVARELSQEDYKSEVPLPSGSDESQCVSDGKGNSSHGFDESGYLTASCQSMDSSVDNHITATESTLCTPSSHRDFKVKGRRLQVDSPDVLAQNRCGQENVLVEDGKSTVLVSQPKSRDQLAKADTVKVTATRCKPFYNF